MELSTKSSLMGARQHSVLTSTAKHGISGGLVKTISAFCNLRRLSPRRAKHKLLPYREPLCNHQIAADSAPSNAHQPQSIYPNLMCYLFSRSTYYTPSTVGSFRVFFYAQFWHVFG